MTAAQLARGLYDGPMARLRHAWTILFVTACVQGGAGLQRVGGSFEAERLRMVDEQLEGRDIRDARVLDAMRQVPRHLFVPESQRPHGVRGCAAADRLRPDHLATLHRGVHDAGAERPAEPSRPGDRNGVRLPGRGARPARRSRVHDRDRRAARGPGPPLRWPTWAIATSRCARATATWDGRSMRPTIASWSRPRPTPCRRRWCSS